ncbi:MAG: hypothetical protein R3D25_08335 [Geminicoccaceae bacterium]
MTRVLPWAGHPAVTATGWPLNLAASTISFARSRDGSSAVK